MHTSLKMEAGFQRSMVRRKPLGIMTTAPERHHTGREGPAPQDSKQRLSVQDPVGVIFR